MSFVLMEAQNNDISLGLDACQNITLVNQKQIYHEGLLGNVMQGLLQILIKLCT